MTISLGRDSEALEAFAAVVVICAMVRQVKTKAFGFSAAVTAQKRLSSMRQIWELLLSLRNMLQIYG
jgi:hypothetical protein